MKNVLKPLAVILAVAGIYFWGIKGEIITPNEQVFNSKEKDSVPAQALSTQRHVQGQGKDIAVSSVPEIGVDDPAEITDTASPEPILVELAPAEPLTEPEIGVDDPAEITITDTASLDPILDELTPAEPLTEPETGVDDLAEITDTASLDPILDELAPAEPEPETGVDDPEEITHTAGVVE